jgi:flavorubredoxin
MFLSMKKILVLYYSRSGNTEKMANAVAEGAKAVSGVQVDLNFHVDPSDLNGYDAILVGAPTYRHEMPIDFKNLFDGAETQRLNLQGKVGAVFGSYGWSGEAPKMLLDIMQQKLGMQATEPPLLAKYIPDQATLDSCRALGKKVAETLMNSA